MLTLVGIIVFIVGIMASIALHEVGHMVPAKKFGVKVTEYFIGFGPTVWSKRKGETDYGVKAIPLGGYVRMIGMFPPRPDGTMRKSSTGRLGMLVDQARNESEAEVLTDADGGYARADGTITTVDAALDGGGSTDIRTQRLSGTAAYDAYFDASGAKVRLMVVGDTGQAVQWTARVRALAS